MCVYLRGYAAEIDEENVVQNKIFEKKKKAPFALARYFFFFLFVCACVCIIVEVNHTLFCSSFFFFALLEAQLEAEQRPLVLAWQASV